MYLKELMSINILSLTSLTLDAASFFMLFYFIFTLLWPSQYCIDPFIFNPNFRPVAFVTSLFGGSSSWCTLIYSLHLSLFIVLGLYLWVIFIVNKNPLPPLIYLSKTDSFPDLEIFIILGFPSKQQPSLRIVDMLNMLQCNLATYFTYFIRIGTLFLYLWTT